MKTIILLMFLVFMNMDESIAINPKVVTNANQNTVKSKQKKNLKKSKKIKLEDVKPISTEEVSPESSDVTEILYPDEIGKSVSHMVVQLANRLDSFFGEARSDDEKNGSTLRIIPTHTFYDGRKDVSELGVNLNLKLLNLEAKAKNFEKKIRDGFAGAVNAPISNDNVKQKSQIPEANNEIWHFNFESKLASRPAIYYSGKFRARRNFEGSLFLHHFSYSAGWDTDDYWSQKISFHSDNAINENLLLRIANEASWFMTRQLVETGHGPSLINTINQYNSVSYNFRLSFGSEENKFQHINTSYSINYRHGTPSKRVFIDLIPSYSYPRAESYKEIRSLELRLEYIFGDI